MNINYYWCENKTALRWFNGRRKPKDGKHQLISLGYTPINLLCQIQNIQDIFRKPDPFAGADAMIISTLTNPYGDYRVTSRVFFNSPKFMSSHVVKYYDSTPAIPVEFEGTNIVFSSKLEIIFDTGLKTYVCNFTGVGLDNAEHAKLLDSPAVHNSVRSALHESNLIEYMMFFQKLPEIADYMFSVAPKVSRKPVAASEPNQQSF